MINKQLIYTHPEIGYAFKIQELVEYTQNTGALIYKNYKDLYGPAKRHEIFNLDEFCSKLREDVKFKTKKQATNNTNNMEKQNTGAGINDLRKYLFNQMERLEDNSLDVEELEKEVKRSRALVGVANSLIDTARIELKFIEANGMKQPSGFMSGQNKLTE